MTDLTRDQQTAALEKDWAENPRWKGIRRGYSAADIAKIFGGNWMRVFRDAWNG